MSQVEPSNPADAIIGTVCLVVGAAIGLLVLAVRLEGLWQFPAGLIRRNPVVMSGLSIGLVLCGSSLLWRTRRIVTTWTPTIPGRRFQAAILYTKADCPLCEEAATVLSSYQRFLSPLQSVDIDERPDLKPLYANCIPVLELDGRKRFVGQINEVLLRRLIEGTPPITAGQSQTGSSFPT